ncbi:MAG: hypothetical protein R3250_04050 [Melioribacteraceae bacterium]|nr:hypothetical protein [Melioribacteraceae bacterium]
MTMEDLQCTCDCVGKVVESTNPSSTETILLIFGCLIVLIFLIIGFKKVEKRNKDDEPETYY